MKKWKKNFMKVPIDILNKLEQITSDNILVSCAKKIPILDIESGVYEHIGITLSDSSVSFEQSITPETDTGRYSKYNMFGREIVLRHLPMVKASYSADVPNFGDWSKGSHDIVWSREVYQRECWMPKNLNINVDLLEQNDGEFMFKFSIDTILSKQDKHYMDDLLYHCNVLQENVGLCDVFDAQSTDSEYRDTLYVDWELLPPGSRNIDLNVNIITGTIRNPNPDLDKEIKERMEFLGLSIILCFYLPFTIKTDLIRILHALCAKFGASSADEGFGEPPRRAPQGFHRKCDFTLSGKKIDNCKRICPQF